MKHHLKFASVVCCVAIMSLLSSKAATIQVQVGAGGLKFTPQDVTIQVGDTVQWTWVTSMHSSTSGTPGNPDGMWDSGIQNSGSGEQVLIGGFIVKDGGKTVLINAKGPSLAAQGVADPISNPRLDLYLGGTVIASNDDWQTNSNASDITASGVRLIAKKLPCK